MGAQTRALFSPDARAWPSLVMSVRGDPPPVLTAWTGFHLTVGAADNVGQPACAAGAFRCVNQRNAGAGGVHRHCKGGSERQRRIKHASTHSE